MLKKSDNTMVPLFLRYVLKHHLGGKVTWYRLEPYLSYSLKRGLGVKEAKEARIEVFKKNEWLK